MPWSIGSLFLSNSTFTTYILFSFLKLLQILIYFFFIIHNISNRSPPLMFLDTHTVSILQSSLFMFTTRWFFLPLFGNRLVWSVRSNFGWKQVDSKASTWLLAHPRRVGLVQVSQPLISKIIRNLLILCTFAASIYGVQSYL